MPETAHNKYNYKPLANYLENRASPLETARHIDQLLHALVYYIDKEGLVTGFFRVYTEIFDLKIVLENMEKTE